MGHAGEFELLTLLAIVRLGEGAYGVTVRDELERRTSRMITLGAVYKTLARLEAKGFVDARVAPPTGARGGRRKKLYRVTSEGSAAVRSSLADLQRLSEGLDLPLEGT